MVEQGYTSNRSSANSRSTSPPDEYFPPSEGLQRSFSGSSQPYNRPPYNAQPHYSYSPHAGSYAGSMPEHIRQRTPSPPSAHSVPKSHRQSHQQAPCPPSLEATERPDTRPILFYVKAVYDYDAEIPEEIALREGQIIAVLATQLDGWWEGEVQDGSSVRRGIFPSNFTEPVSL
ncbi:formin-binding protein [Entomophthora muscae]|uniref:Formin-binding protein n=1 Tax=Entomophthora muscae TaxID=34485 RepID=A0ACC2UJB4_9FUNG|nr:formin-binding protein [Entomophthora muscae]